MLVQVTECTVFRFWVVILCSTDFSLNLYLVLCYSNLVSRNFPTAKMLRPYFSVKLYLICNIKGDSNLHPNFWPDVQFSSWIIFNIVFNTVFLIRHSIHYLLYFLKCSMPFWCEMLYVSKWDIMNNSIPKNNGERKNVVWDTKWV